jgi:hypothetical protein
MAYRNQQYDIALNEQGYILASRPEMPRIVAGQAPIFGSRFAQGDRDYGDFSFWWFLAQTDWSGGFKDETQWKDDAKYYASSFLDCYSEPGAIKMHPGVTDEYYFNENPNVMAEGEVNNSNALFVGTTESGDGKPKLYYQLNADSWGEATDDSSFSSDALSIMDLCTHKNALYGGNNNPIGNTFVVWKWEGIPE